MRNPSPFAQGEAPVELATQGAPISAWWCSLAGTAATRAELEAWLSVAELVRLRRFATDALQTRYVIGRGTLRWLLANTLEITPKEVPLVSGMRGRPQVAGKPGLDFNVSHTGDRALIGFAHDARIGVDIERRDRTINAAGIARKFLTERERAELPEGDPDAVRQQILRLWTCKEAMSKATGDALSAPFRRLDVEIAPSLRLTEGPAPYLPRDWSLHEVPVPADHFATVALWRNRDAADDVRR